MTNEEEAEDQHFAVGMDADQPGIEHGADDDDLADDGRLLGRQPIDQNAHDDAQQRPGQHRGCDHQTFFGMAEAKILGDAHAERAKDDPDHEGEVKVKEGGQQRGRMAGLEE